MRRLLETLTVVNFKSIRQQTLHLGPINVFIGGNGAGKSNLVGVFRFLRHVAGRELQTYVGTTGGANKLLHFGRRRSPSLSIKLEFVGKNNLANGYGFTLVPTEEDRFVFEWEHAWFHDRDRYASPYNVALGGGHSESRLRDSSEPVTGHVERDLARYLIYHFHDTSPAAPVKQTCDLHDNRLLKPDASNLAAFLFRLQQTDPGHFRTIEDAIRQIAPFFDAFHLEPSRLNPEKIRLEWREKANDDYFNAHSLSDGTLRFICLATLFLQPDDDKPEVILIDEPELGLHPSAIALLSELMQTVSTDSQILVATQSVTLVNQFGPEDVWVTDRFEGASVFRHLEHEDMSAWLDEYALGELWEKNVLGGRP